MSDGDPNFGTIAQQVSRLESRMTVLERHRATDVASNARIESKVDGLLRIVVQFQGVAHFLKVCAGIATFAASIAAIIIAAHAIWP